MQKQLIDHTTIWIFTLAMFLGGVFIGVVLDRVYYHKVFTKEIIVKVTPIGWVHNPYKHSFVRGRIDRQEFKIVFNF